MRALRILAGIAVLASCGSQQEDLPAELSSLTQDFRPRVEPLPQPKALESIKYQAAGLPDPFAPKGK